MKVLTITGLAVLLALLPLQRAAATIVSELGTAGPGYWAALAIGNGTMMVEGNIGGGSAVWGNTGIASPGSLTMSGSSFIYGDLYLGNTATTNFSGGSGVTGTTFTNQDPVLTAAGLAAMAASTFYAGMGSAHTDITSSLTLSAGIYNLSNINLGGTSTLTLNGSGDFVFNISNLLMLGGSAQIILTGGATADNVLFNITGTTTADLEGSAILQGIILAPNADVTVDSGIGPGHHVGVYGEVVSGGNITIQSGSGIVGVPPTTPDGGSTVALLGIALAGIEGARRLIYPRKA
jgi:choice-of-anchor A domain-containing protein